MQKVDVLCGIGIKKVACGTQFSVALTKDGHVYTFGQGKTFSKHYIAYFVYTCVIETSACLFYGMCSKLSHFFVLSDEWPLMTFIHKLLAVLFLSHEL